MNEEVKKRLMTIFSAELEAAFQAGSEKATIDISEEERTKIYNQGFNDAARCAHAMYQMDNGTRMRVFHAYDFSVITPMEFHRWEEYEKEREEEKKKYGEWRPREKDEWYGDQGECPYCDHVTIDLKHYCPNCGAQLRGDEEEKEHE